MIILFKRQTIISGQEILNAMTNEPIGSCSKGKIFKHGEKTPIGYYSNGTSGGAVTEPPPDSGKVIGQFDRSDNEEGPKAAAFLLLLSKQ